MPTKEEDILNAYEKASNMSSKPSFSNKEQEILNAHSKITGDNSSDNGFKLSSLLSGKVNGEDTTSYKQDLIDLATPILKPIAAAQNYINNSKFGKAAQEAENKLNLTTAKALASGTNEDPSKYINEAKKINELAFNAGTIAPVIGLSPAESILNPAIGPKLPGSMLGKETTKLSGPAKLIVKAVSTSTGIPESDIAHYAQHTGEVDKLIKDSGGSIDLAANNFKESLMKNVKDKKTSLYQNINDELLKASPEKTIDVGPILGSLEVSKGKLNPTLKADEIGQIDNLIQQIKTLAPENRIDLKNLFDVKEHLQGIASGTYIRDGQLFQSGDSLSKASKNAGMIARKTLNEAAPEIAAANNQLSALHNIDSKINKNLITTDKSNAALLAAGSNIEGQNARLIGKLGDFAGVDTTKQLQSLSAAKQFNNPGLLPADLTGKSLTRIGASSILLSKVLGPQLGPVVGLAFSSPAVLKKSIQSGIVPINLVNKLANNAGPVTDKVMESAIKAIGTPAGINLTSQIINNETSAIQRRKQQLEGAQ